MTIVNIRLENITTNMQLNYLKGAWKSPTWGRKVHDDDDYSN